MMKSPIPAVLASLMIASPALGNDTTAELKTGGLSYVQTLDISMEQEDLFVSAKEIRVDYVFRNTTDKDVETLVAFPLPDINGDVEPDVALDEYEDANFLHFVVTQDGQPIKPNLQQRVTVNGIDMTDEVKARNISMLPRSKVTAADLEKLPEDVKADWLARGLIIADDYDQGNGMEHHLKPVWTLGTVFWWKTKFPAGKDVRVHHSYTPSVGGTVSLDFIKDGKPNGEIYTTYRQRYCIDDSFMKAAAKLEKAATNDPSKIYSESWISYILTTGANWSGEIKKFHLTVDKGAANNVVSLCGTGIKKTGATTFEMRAEDFYPERDLEILILNAPQ